MNLPTEQQCLGYFGQYKVPQNILGHCLKVKEVAVFLARKLKESGVDIDVELVGRIALLHDLFKMVVVEDLTASTKYFNYEYSAEELVMWKHLRENYPGMHECEVAHVIFKDEFPELAAAIKNASDPQKEDKSMEESVVHYADWRVFSNKIVLLRERLEDLKVRYVWGDEYWENRAGLMTKEESKIFSRLRFSPEMLEEEIGR